MGWKVVISPGDVDDPDAFTVDAKAKFDLQARVHDDESGKVQYIEYFVDVEGDIVESSAGSVADELFATLIQVQEYNPRNVYLVLDDTTKFNWQALDCVGSPRILAFRTIEEDGNADSHWRYGFTIYVKQGGNPIPGTPNASELQTSLLIVTENGEVVKKVWRAYAKAGSVAAALAAVMRFKPSDPTLHEEIERFFQDNSVRASWTWELYKNFYITEEPVQYIGAGKSFVWDYAVSDGNNPPPPVIHRAANEVTKIIVRGIVRGTNPGVLAAPQPHYQDNGNTMIRNEAEEENSFPGLEDPLKGVWARPYMEVWYFTGTGRPPGPNHSNHQKPSLIAPNNGPIGA